MNFYPKPKEIQWVGKEKLEILPKGRVCLHFNPEDPELTRTAGIIASELRTENIRVSIRQNDESSSDWIFELETACDIPLPEGYCLTVSEHRIHLNGTTWRGVLCAYATLRQMFFRGARPHTCARACIIRDWPDVPYRACSRWLLDFEGGRMACDWGTGRLDTFRRYRRKIDFAMHHKINLVFFEGFSFERNKYPEYSSDLKKLNRYAAERNVLLEYGGHGIGIGGRNPNYHDVAHCGFVKGLGGLNRTHYPDGEVYDCMGMSELHPTRRNGSCRSNHELNRLKQQDLADFVKRVQPRALYIHHEDIGSISVLEKDWSLRCDSCRKQWPDDTVLSEHGALGAIAYGMNRLYEAICSVKDARTGYDGAKDCIVIFVPPGYGAGPLSAEKWNKIVGLFRMLSRLLVPSELIYLCCREQFFQENGKDLCIRQLADAVTYYHHHLFVFAVNGADSYLNDALFASGAMLNGFYRGADAVFNFSGTLFQEPLEVFNAECCWNLPAVDASMASHEYLPGTEARSELCDTIPDALFASDGFLNCFCQDFYGKEAGKFMIRLLKLREKDGSESRYPLLNTCYQFRKLPQALFESTDSLSDFNCGELYEKWKSIHDLTRKAQNLASKMSHCRLSPFPGEVIRHMTVSLQFCLLLSGLCKDIFRNNRSRKKLRKKLADCKSFLKNNFQTDFLSESDGEHSAWNTYLSRIEKVLDKHENFPIH